VQIWGLFDLKIREFEDLKMITHVRLLQSVPKFKWNTPEHRLERFGTLWNAFGTLWNDSRFT